MKTRKRRGFTLVELIVVIAVIGILAAVLIPTFSGAFTSANLAADRGDAANMTRILRTAFLGDIPDNIEAPEIRDAIRAEDEFSFVPRSSGDGYSFWFDLERQEVTIEKASGLEVSAGAAGRQAASLEEIVSGYLLLDVGGNPVADLLASFRNLLSLDEYNTLKASAEALKSSLPAGYTAAQIDALIKHLVGEDNPDNFSPSHNLYINDFGSFTTASGGIVTRMIFSDGITMISSVSAVVTAVKNDIVVPASVSFVEAGAFTAIRQTEGDDGIIETNLIFRDTDIKVESSAVFSDYLLQKTPGLSNLPLMRTEPVGEVEFKVTFDQPAEGKEGWTVEDGFYVKADETGSTEYRPFRLTINPQVLSVEDDQIYISDTWRFRYQNLPDGSVAVQVKLFDSEGVVGEDTITYRVPETLNLSFKDGSSTLRFSELTSALGFAEKTGEKVTYTLSVGDQVSYTFYKGIVQDLQAAEEASLSTETAAWLTEQGYLDGAGLTEKGKTLQAALSMSGLFGEFNFGTERKVDSISDIAFLLEAGQGWKAYLGEGEDRTEVTFDKASKTWKSGGSAFAAGDVGAIYFERVSEKPENVNSSKTVSGKLTQTISTSNPSTTTYTLKRATAADVKAYKDLYGGLEEGTLIMISRESGTSQTITTVEVDVNEDGVTEADLGFTQVQFIEYHTFNYFLASVYGVEEDFFGTEGIDLSLSVSVGDQVVIRETLNKARPESESSVSQTIANQENTSYQYAFSYRYSYEPGRSTPILEMGQMKVKTADGKVETNVDLYTAAQYEQNSSLPGYDYFYRDAENKGDYEIVGFDSKQEGSGKATLTWNINFSNLKYKFKEGSDEYNQFDNIQATDAMTNREPYEINYQIKSLAPVEFNLTYLNGRQVSQAGDSPQNPIVLAKGELLLESGQTYGVAEGVSSISLVTTVRPIDNLSVNVLEISGWDTSAVTETPQLMRVRYYPDGIGHSLYAESQLYYVVRETVLEDASESLAGSAVSNGTMAQINGREVAEDQTFLLTEGEDLSLTNNTRMYYLNGGSAVSVYFNAISADFGSANNRQKLIVEIKTQNGQWTQLTKITEGNKTYTSGTPLTRPGETYNVTADQLLELPASLKAGSTGTLRFTYVFRVNVGGSYGTGLTETVAFSDEVDFRIVSKSGVDFTSFRLDYNSAEPDQSGTGMLTVEEGTEISRLNAAYGSYLQILNAQGTTQTCYLYSKAPYSSTTYLPNDYLVNVTLGDQLILGSGEGWTADSAYTVKAADNGKTLTYTLNYYGVVYEATVNLRVVSDLPVRLVSLNGIRYYDGLVYEFAPNDQLISGSATQIYYYYTASYETGFSLPATASATNYMKFWLSSDPVSDAGDAEWAYGKTFKQAWDAWELQGKAQGETYYLIIRAMSSNTQFEDIAVPFVYREENQTVTAQVYTVNGRNVLSYGVFEVLHNEGLCGWSNYIGMSIYRNGTFEYVYYVADTVNEDGWSVDADFDVFVRYEGQDWVGDASAPLDKAQNAEFVAVPQPDNNARTFVFDAAKGAEGVIRLEYTEGSTTYIAEAPFRVSGMRLTYLNNRTYSYRPDDKAESVLSADKTTLTTTLTEPFLFFENEVFTPFAAYLSVGAYANQNYRISDYLGWKNNAWCLSSVVTSVSVYVTDENKGSEQQVTPENLPAMGALGKTGYLKFSFTGTAKLDEGDLYATDNMVLELYIPYEVYGSNGVLTETELEAYGLSNMEGVLRSRIYRINNRQTDNSQSIVLYDGEQIALHESYSATSMAIFAPDGRRREIYSAATNGINPYYGVFGRNYGTEALYNVSNSSGKPGYNEFWMIKLDSDSEFQKLGLDPDYVGASGSELIRANYLDHVFKTGESGTLVWVREQYGITYLAEIHYTVEASEPLNGQDWENWSEEEISDLIWDQQDTNLQEMLVTKQAMELTWFEEPDQGTTFAETRELPYKFARYEFENETIAYLLREWSSDIHSKVIKNQENKDVSCYVALYDPSTKQLISEISESMRLEEGVNLTLVYIDQSTGSLVLVDGEPQYAQLSTQEVTKGVSRGDAYLVDTKKWQAVEGEEAPSYAVKVLKTPPVTSDAQVGIIGKINGTEYPFLTGNFMLEGDAVSVDSTSSVKVLTRNGYFTNVPFSEKFRYFVKGEGQSDYIELKAVDGKLDLSSYQTGTLKVVFYYSDIYYVAERSFEKGDPGIYRVTNVNGRNPGYKTEGDDQPAEVGIPLFVMAKGEAITSAYGNWSRQGRPDSTLYFSGLTSVSTAWTYYFYPGEYLASWTIPALTEDMPVDMMTWRIAQSGYLVVSYTSGMTLTTAIYLEIREEFTPAFNLASIRLSLRSASDKAESARAFTPGGGGYGIEDPNLLILSGEDGILATTGTSVRFTRPDGSISTTYVSESNLQSDKIRLYLQGENIQGDEGDAEGRKKLTLDDLLRSETAGKALLEPTLKATYTVEEEGAEKTLYGAEAAKYYSRYSESNSQITDAAGGSWQEGEARIEITRTAVLDEATGACTMTVTEKYYPADAETGSAPERMTVTIYQVEYYAVKLIIEYDDYGITYRGEWNLIVLA